MKQTIQWRGSLTSENWANIEGYPNYMISTFGRLKNIKRSKIKCAKRSSNGYYQHIVFINGERKYIGVHRMMAMAFIDNPHNKKEINHIDCNPSNNELSNLEWMTPNENKKYAYTHGLRVKKYGHNNPMSKIVLNNQTGIFYMTLKEAANTCNIKMGTLSHYLCGRLVNKTNFKYV